MTSLFIDLPFEQAADGYGLDIPRTLMNMEASQCPVLVRRDPDGDWWVITQGPIGQLHCHVIDQMTAVMTGHESAWRAALAQADLDTRPWLAARARESGDPEQLRAILDRLFESFQSHLPTIPEEE